MNFDNIKKKYNDLPRSTKQVSIVAVLVVILILIVSCSGPKHEPLAQYRPQYQPPQQVVYQPAPVQYDQQHEQPQYHQPQQAPQVVVQQQPSSNGIATNILAGAAGYYVGSQMSKPSAQAPAPNYSVDSPSRNTYTPVTPATRVLPSAPVIAAKPVAPVATPVGPNYRPATAPVVAVTPSYRPPAAVTPTYRTAPVTTSYRPAPSAAPTYRSSYSPPSTSSYRSSPSYSRR